MNEERFEAYRNLINSLLNCSEGKEWELLQAHSELLDSDFIKLVEQVAEELEDKGDEEGADFLWDAADTLGNIAVYHEIQEVIEKLLDCAIDQEAWQILDANRDLVDSRLVQMMEKVVKDLVEESNEGEADFLIDVVHQLNFLLQVLRVTNRSSENPEVVYPLLEKNLDLLDNNFAQVLRSWATAILPKLEPKQTWDTAAVIGDFSLIIKQLQMGDLASNLEIAIAGEEIVAEIFRREAFPEEWAINQINLGNSYDSYDESIGGNEEENRETAIRHYQAALQVLKRDKSPNLWAGAMGNLGIAYCKRLRGVSAKNLNQGITDIHSALQVYNLKEFPKEWALFQQHLGSAYMSLADEERIERKSAENLKAAIIAFQSALKVYNLNEFPKEWADNQINLGSVYNELGKIDEAIACYRRSLEVYTPTDYCSESLETARCFGDTAFNAGRWAEAIEGYGIAIEALEHSRILERLYPLEEGITLMFVPVAIEIYPKMVQACINLKQFERAIEYVERSKVRNLLELLNEIAVNEANIPLDTLEEYKSLCLEIDVEQRDRNIQGVRQAVGFSTATLSEPDRLNELRKQLDELIDRNIKPHDSTFIHPKWDKPIAFREMQRLLSDNNTVMIEWYITDEKFLTFIITPEGRGNSSGFVSSSIVLESSQKEYEALADWGNQYINDYLNNTSRWRGHLEKRLQSLAELLDLDRILSLYIPADCNQLILIPHRFLHLLPLHALPLRAETETPFCLLERFKKGVRYAPSCALLRQVQNQKRSHFECLFAIQNPTKNLDYADIEVTAIRQFFKPNDNVFVKDDAKKDCLDNKRLRLAHCIHFSCHGKFEFEGGIDKSELFLADDSLNLPEIFDFDLCQCRLVTLSACETGLTFTDFVSTGGDEYIGLPSAFLFAGSSSVVSSLWTVDDLSTALLMVKFYENLRNQMSLAVALNQAQFWLRDINQPQLLAWSQQLKLENSLMQKIKQRLDWFNPDEQPFQDPYYWAPFCAIGE